MCYGRGMPVCSLVPLVWGLVQLPWCVLACLWREVRSSGAMVPGGLLAGWPW
jgi:hypothetical protein